MSDFARQVDVLRLRRHTREIASTPDDDSELEDLVFVPEGHSRDRDQDERYAQQVKFMRRAMGSWKN